MDGSGECAGIRSQLGVYLTGAIAPADRAAVVRHLAGCEGCRAELAGLAGLPALLSRPDVAAAAQPPADDRLADPGDEASGAQAGQALLTRLLSGVTRRRHRLPVRETGLRVRGGRVSGFAGDGSPGSRGAGLRVRGGREREFREKIRAVGMPPGRTARGPGPS